MATSIIDEDPALGNDLTVHVVTKDRGQDAQDDLQRLHGPRIRTNIVPVSASGSGCGIRP